MVLLARNDRFQKHFILPTRNASLRKMEVLEDGSGTPRMIPEDDSSKCGFRKVPDKCRIYENNGNWLEHDPYETSRAETRSK